MDTIISILYLFWVFISWISPFIIGILVFIAFLGFGTVLKNALNDHYRAKDRVRDPMSVFYRPDAKRTFIDFVNSYFLDEEEHLRNYIERLDKDLAVWHKTIELLVKIERRGKKIRMNKDFSNEVKNLAHSIYLDQASKESAKKELSLVRMGKVDIINQHIELQDFREKLGKEKVKMDSDDGMLIKKQFRDWKSSKNEYLSGL